MECGYSKYARHVIVPYLVVAARIMLFQTYGMCPQPVKFLTSNSFVNNAERVALDSNLMCPRLRFFDGHFYELDELFLIIINLQVKNFLKSNAPPVL